MDTSVENIMIISDSTKDGLSEHFWLQKSFQMGSAETGLKVSFQSRKFEFNVFSIIHLNGLNF